MDKRHRREGRDAIKRVIESIPEADIITAGNKRPLVLMGDSNNHPGLG